MIEEKAVVVSSENNKVIVEASRHSACGQCSAKSGCGQSSVAQWAASKMMNISVDNPQSIHVSKGDVVIVGIRESSFIKASLLLYFYPLIFMFFAGMLATLCGLAEWQVICCSFLTLFVSFYGVKFYSNKLKHDSSYQLTLLTVLQTA